MRESLPASLTDRSTYRSISLRPHLLAGIGPGWRRFLPRECTGEFRGPMEMACEAGRWCANPGWMTDQRADSCEFAVRATEIPRVGLGHRDRIRTPHAAQRWLSIGADRALVSPIVTACQPRRSCGQVVQIAVFRAKCERRGAASTLGACVRRPSCCRWDGSGTHDAPVCTGQTGASMRAIECVCVDGATTRCFPSPPLYGGGELLAIR